MSMISRTAQYALRAMSLLATQEGRMTVKQLAQAVGAPQPYLARIIMTLADTGMVDARRGPGGGLRLGREADKISLYDIVTCFDGHTLFTECALGLPGCSEAHRKCPVHSEWGAIREKIRMWWMNTSLGDFSPEKTTECMSERVQTRVEVYSRMSHARGRWH
jgi:Rrf2 family iron-sulfur cluster assembly transcriptional regulator